MEHSNYTNPLKKDRGEETYVITAHGASFKSLLPVEQEPSDIDMRDIEFNTLVEDSYGLLSGKLSYERAACKIRDDICEQRAKLYRKLTTYYDMVLDIDRHDRFIAGVYKCNGFMPIINFNDIPDKFINKVQYKISLSETIRLIKQYHIKSSNSHKIIKIVAAFCLSGLPKELDVIEGMLKDLDLDENSETASIGSISDLSSLLVKKRLKSKLQPIKTIKKKKKKVLTKKGKIKKKLMKKEKNRRGKMEKKIKVKSTKKGKIKTRKKNSSKKGINVKWL